MIIAVASGKGGTGKTTVATNLALVLAQKIKVQFLDCDVEEPNAHLFKTRAKSAEPVSIPFRRLTGSAVLLRALRRGLCI